MNKRQNLSKMTHEEISKIKSERQSRVISQLQPRQREAVRTTPAMYRYRYALALSGEASITQAVYAKCRECVGYEDAPIRISECLTQRCPLWAYRPHQKNITDPVSESE